MKAHHRKSYLDVAPDLPPRFTSSEGGQVPDQPEKNVSQRRVSLGHVSEHGLATLNELLSPLDSTDNPPRRRSSANAQVKPVSSNQRKTSLKSKVSRSRTSRRVRSSIRLVYFKESFYDVYGYLGLVMLVAFTLSFFAMVYMTVVQVVPNQTANFLMDTETLDNGDFLLISKPQLSIVVASALMLSVFGCMYIWLIVFMLSYNNEATVNNLAQAPNPTSFKYRLMQKLLPLLKRVRAQTTTAESESSAQVSNPPSRLRSFEKFKSLGTQIQRTSSFGSSAASKLILDFTSMNGTYHRYYDALLDFPKLIFQTMSLSTYLRKGFPLPIIMFYVLPLGFNWLISFYRFQRNKPDPMLIIARIFYLFDLFFAVFAPIMMLVYSYYNFHLDRENFGTREETLTPGSFDRISRLFADPIEVQLVKTSFANLQITEGEYILVKCFLNLLGIYKWKKVIAHLILANRSRREDNSSGTKYHAHPHSRKHTIVGGMIFIFCSLAIAIYTSMSLSTSIKNCAPYPHCAVFSYRWDWNEKSSCPCIVFIDRELAPRTYSEWIDAPDVTEAVSALASNGYLQTVQIVNRALPKLPEELRKCTKLKDLILIYTKTRRFPEWMKEFTHLEYFHVENDFIHSSLQYLPNDMFTDMHHLRFLRTGGASGLTTYPSLTGLHSLSTLVLSIVRGLTQLPKLEDLPSLTTFYVADAVQVPRLPSLTNLPSLKNFAIFRRNAMCCNGWATGLCDLSNFQCLQRANEPAVQCVSDRISNEELAEVQRIDGFLCGKNITQDVDVSEPSLESTDAECQGVLYRECHLDGIRGICYNGRMQIVHCDVFGEYEKMRRLQIARGVGDKCKPDVEAWLGC